MSESAFRTAVVHQATVAGIQVPTPPQLAQLEQYYQLLDKWNRRINLTALQLGMPPPPETVDRLFTEALVAAEMIEDARLSVVDVGSGAGSPAIPLKIVRPPIRLTLVEVRSRKASFLREVVRGLSLADVVVEERRFQELKSTHRKIADLVIVRAVRLDSELLATVEVVLKAGGRLMTFGGQPLPPEFEPIQHRGFRDQAPIRTFRMGPRSQS